MANLVHRCARNVDVEKTRIGRTLDVYDQQRQQGDFALDEGVLLRADR